ncbi:MAG: hypothetical protein IPI78_14700 [Chitinophagaceae bacterium]|nr:hypothetical protein [Chitinophagaceae bacterium]
MNARWTLLTNGIMTKMIYLTVIMVDGTTVTGNVMNTREFETVKTSSPRMV